MNVRRNLYTPREAAQMMGISYPTLKKSILDGKLKTIKTPGGHHRIAPEDINAFLGQGTEPVPMAGIPRISGVNQLQGEVIGVQISGFIAEVELAIGDLRIRAIVNVANAEELDLKEGDTVTAFVRSTDIMIGCFDKGQKT